MATDAFTFTLPTGPLAAALRQLIEAAAACEAAGCTVSVAHDAGSATVTIETEPAIAKAVASAILTPAA